MSVASVVNLAYATVYAIIAYLLPGYQTFKAIERHSTQGSSIEVRQWATYWACFAAFYCLQVFIDLALCWLPFYYLLKLGFVLSLWHPSSHLATSLYSRAFGPIVATYEADIDALYYDGKARALDLMSHQATVIKARARDFSGHANDVLRSVQKKTLERMDKAKTASSSSSRSSSSGGRGGAMGAEAVGHGLHTE